MQSTFLSTFTLISILSLLLQLQHLTALVTCLFAVLSIQTYNVMSAELVNLLFCKKKRKKKKKRKTSLALVLYLKYIILILLWYGNTFVHFKLQFNPNGVYWSN